MCVCVCSAVYPNDLSGRMYHLEVMLKQLNTDLEKVRTDLRTAARTGKQTESSWAY